MIRHISIFKFKETGDNGKGKAENIETVRAYLEKLPALYPAMAACQVGVAVQGDAPPLPDGAGPVFGDLVQISDYDTPEAAAGFPPSKAHMDLVTLSDPMLESVTAIDFVF